MGIHPSIHPSIQPSVPITHHHIPSLPILSQQCQSPTIIDLHYLSLAITSHHQPSVPITHHHIPSLPILSHQCPSYTFTTYPFSEIIKITYPLKEKSATFYTV